MSEDFGEKLADLVKKSDAQISDEMTEILRLKRIAEAAQKMFEAERNANTPIPVALEEESVSVELSPRDVGEMYTLIKRLSRSPVGEDWMSLIKDANSFIYRHEPIRNWRSMK